MANTYTQIYVQVVFAVNGRQSLINSSFKEDLFKYIGGTMRNAGQKLIAINGMPDHVHILLGLKPTVAVSDFVKDIKVASSRLINDKKWVRGRFSWQEGFGAFSHSQSHLSKVARYIENQERHHARRSFRDEYSSMLKNFQIEHNERYLFKWIEK
ncbi:MAG: IS200/IS605 family transposase [Acidobacteriota bacterium]